MRAPASQETKPMLERFRQLGYPEVTPVPDGVDRPFWSVMIPTYNCAIWLRETLKSVLAQDPGPERMQIEVMDDASTKDDPEAVVRELGRGRVAFHRHPKNVGATANFNASLSRSRGHLVQILHGDDLVLPGFYSRMEGLLERNPEAGSAICRFAAIDENDVWLWLSHLVQRNPGVAPNALAVISSQNWAQFAAVALKRSLVEAVGGFHPSLIHAADWDLWKRAALHQPLAYEPTVLALYRMFDGNDSSRLMRTGANVADLRRAIDLSARYLPSPQSVNWIRAARRNFANDAAINATQMLINGDYDAFHSQLREAGRLDRAFYWSRGHLQLRYWALKKSVKRRLMEGRTRIMKNRLPVTAPSSASTTNRS